MSGIEIRQLGPPDASEYQVIFLEALRFAPEAFAADYEQESARSLEEVVERFQREAIYGGFVSGRLQAIATFQRQTMPKRRAGTARRRTRAIQTRNTASACCTNGD